MRTPQPQGFTLIELLLVLAMVATLAAVALPRYQNYLQRARWSANLQAMNAAQTALASCLQENTATDCASWVALGLSPADNTITLPQGRVTLLADAAGFELTGTDKAGRCVVRLTLRAEVGGLTQRWQTALQNNGASGCTRDSTGVALAGG
jgi:prepilin-type N-terminal cleavage/methylation domain-containing protein